MKWREIIFLAVVLVLAVGVRLGVAGHQVFVFDDSRSYLRLAQTFIDVRDYQDEGLYANRMPGYPFFVSVILYLQGDLEGLGNIAMVQAVMGGLCVLPVYLIGRRISVGAGAVGAILVAVDPLQIGFGAAILSEIPFTLVFLMALWVAMRIIEKDRLWEWAVFGVLWGVAVYLRASVYWLMVPLGAFAICCHAWQQRDNAAGRRKVLVRSTCGVVLAVALMAMVLLPWNLRNAKRFGPHHWLTTIEGISLYEAVYPEADGGPMQDKILLPAEMVTMGEAARNQEWNRRAWGYIWGDPVRMAKLGVIKMGRTWSPWLNAADFTGAWYQPILVAVTIPLYILALAGLLSRRIPWKVAGIIVLPILYFTAVHTLFLGSVRYRVPVMPLVDLLAAVGIVQGIGMARTRWGGQASVVVKGE